MKKLILFFLFLFSISANAQFVPPSVEWQKSFGGSNDDGANCIKATNDGGFIVIGKAKSTNFDLAGSGIHTGYDYWVIKLNSQGDTLWKHAYGGSSDDIGTSVVVTSDGEYVLAGYTNSTSSGDVNASHGLNDFWIVRINATGQIGPNDWKSTYGGSSDDKAYDIQETFDGGYIVAGETQSNSTLIRNNGAIDGWVVKLGYAGDYQYGRAIGGSNSEHIYSIQQTTDSGFIVAGYTNSNNGDVAGNHGNDDAWVAKLNKVSDSLTVRHQICLGGSNYDYARQVRQTPDGGYIVAGYSNSNDGTVNGDNHGGFDYWVVKLDSGLSTVQWAKSYGGSADDKAYSIVVTGDSGYVITGSSNSLDGNVSGAHGGQDYWIVKLDNTGAIKRQHAFGGTGDDYAFSIAQVPAPDDGYVVAGSSNSSDGDAAVFQNMNHLNSNDYWIIRFTEAVGLEEKNAVISSFDVSPNPVRGNALISFSMLASETVSVKMYDLAGRVVKTFEHKNFSTGFHQLSFNASGLESGMYLLTLETKGGSLSKKVAVVK